MNDKISGGCTYIGYIRDAIKPFRNNFPAKLYRCIRLADCYEETSKIARWTDDGDAIMILDRARFVEMWDGQWSSFHRNLTSYSFTAESKPGTQGRSEIFRHPVFRRDNQAESEAICRKEAKPVGNQEECEAFDTPVTSSFSRFDTSLGADANIVDTLRSTIHHSADNLFHRLDARISRFYSMAISSRHEVLHGLSEDTTSKRKRDSEHQLSVHEHQDQTKNGDMPLTQEAFDVWLSNTSIETFKIDDMEDLNKPASDQTMSGPALMDQIGEDNATPPLRNNQHDLEVPNYRNSVKPQCLHCKRHESDDIYHLRGNNVEKSLCSPVWCFSKEEDGKFHIFYNERHISMLLAAAIFFIGFIAGKHAE